MQEKELKDLESEFEHVQACGYLDTLTQDILIAFHLVEQTFLFLDSLLN